MNTSVEYIGGGAELLDRIHPLWEELRLHHADIGHLWKEDFLNSAFEKRKAGLIEKSERGLLVLLALDQSLVVGYCVSSINGNGRGEIDSIFVTDRARGAGIGTELVRRSMAWLNENGATPIAVAVLAGNDGAVKLYERFGFQLRTLIMQHRE